MRRRLRTALANRVWYGGSPLYVLLMPLSWLFYRVAAARRRLYLSGAMRTFHAGCPVVVVGNIVSGGAGKTPVTLWLAAYLKDSGLRPGIVSRGYGATVGAAPREVSPDDSAAAVGDEPLLMARRLVCPVVVHPDRVSAARMLVEMGCNVVLADDGLQHYRLERQLEIAVVDAQRGFGNGRLLPAGPLREPPARLRSVDRIMLQGGAEEADRLQRRLPGDVPRTRFELRPGTVRQVLESRTAELDEWRGGTVHAVAGIGYPERFFRMLQAHGITVIPHAFPDHAGFSRDDLEYQDGLDVLMTEKDAVRVEGPAPANCWQVPVDLVLVDTDEPDWLPALAKRLAEGMEQPA